MGIDASRNVATTTLSHRQRARRAMGAILLASLTCLALLQGSRAAAQQPAGGSAGQAPTTQGSSGVVEVRPLLKPEADEIDVTTRPYAVPSVASDAANLTWRDMPAHFADYYCIQGFGAPMVPSPKPAFCKSSRPLQVHTPQGILTSPMLFDQSTGSGVYDTLYVDFNANGDFQDDPVYKAVPFESIQGPDTGEVVSYFPNVKMMRSGQRGWTPLVQIFLEFIPGRGRDRVPFNICAIPQRWAVGTVQVDGQARPVALIDHNWNGKVTDISGMDRRLLNDGMTYGDYMILGEPGEKELRPNERKEPYRINGSPRVFLTPYLQLASGLYEIKAGTTEQGVKLEFVPASLPMATLDLPGYEGDRLVLTGQKVSVLLHSADRRITVPEDTYSAQPTLGGSLRGEFVAGEQEVAPAVPTKPAPQRPREVTVGGMAPDFETRTVDGKSVKLSDYRGKVVLLDFWATWCPPCIAEIPRLKAMHERFSQDGRFVILSLSLDEDEQALKSFLARNPLPWVQAHPTEQEREQIVRQYEIVAIPATFLIGPDGKVLAKGLRGAAIAQAVAKALAGSPTATQSATSPASR